MCAPRSYVVDTAGGSFRRNCKHLGLQAGPDTVYDPAPQPGAAPDPVPEPGPDSLPAASTGSRTTATSVQSVPNPGGTYLTRSGRSVPKPARFRED